MYILETFLHPKPKYKNTSSAKLEISFFVSFPSNTAIEFLFFLRSDFLFLK